MAAEGEHAELQHLQARWRLSADPTANNRRTISAVPSLASDGDFVFTAKGSREGEVAVDAAGELYDGESE